jgi:integrase
MAKVNAKNERVKHRYLAYLRDARQQSEATVDQAAASITLFEASTGYKDFAAFHIEQARKFKRDLEANVNVRTGKSLSKATIRSRTTAVKEFVLWLCHEPGYRSKLDHRDAAYFNLSANDERIATAKRPKRIATLEQIRNLVSIMPCGTDLDRRDRALIAFAILTGARDGALATFQINNVDVDGRRVLQDARNVATKFRKTFPTWFFPVGDDFEGIVREWIVFLTLEKGFGPSDPLFPKTKNVLDVNGQFAPAGVDRAFWRGTSSIRTIYRRAFGAAGLTYSNPQTFRDTLALLGSKTCRTPEELKAWSQNLGHESVLTTLGSYGTVPDHRQAEIMDELRISSEKAGDLSPATIRRVLEHLQQHAKSL